MATVYDLPMFKRLMEIVKKDHPCRRYIGDMYLEYAPFQSCWVASFCDCDVHVFFNEIDYSSNNIILKYNGNEIANFCHTHQRL